MTKKDNYDAVKFSITKPSDLGSYRIWYLRARPWSRQESRFVRLLSLVGALVSFAVTIPVITNFDNTAHGFAVG